MAKSINPFDRVLKIIARNFPESLLRVALPSASFQLLGTPENIEIAIPEERVDFVHRVQFGGEEKIVHIEFQTRHEADMPHRLFVYSGLLTKQFERQVLTLVFYLARREKPLPTAYEVLIDDTAVNRFEYPVIKLWEYADQIRAGQWPELAPLLVMFTEDEPDEATLTQERNLILQEQDSQKRADLLACAITIGARFFDRDFLWNFFREEVEMIREASFIEDWLDEKLELGLQRGLQQGLEQGLEQGEAQGAKRTRVSDILQILSRRFANVPISLTDTIQLLTAEQMEPLVLTALDAATLDDFMQELNKIMLSSRKNGASN